MGGFVWHCMALCCYWGVQFIEAETVESQPGIWCFFLTAADGIDRAVSPRKGEARVFHRSTRFEKTCRRLHGVDGPDREKETKHWIGVPTYPSSGTAPCEL